MAGDQNSKSAASSGSKPLARSTPVLVPQGVLASQPEVPLDRPVTTVGSNENARLHLVSRTVSKGHAIFVNSGGVTYVADLASRTGVLVNGKLVRDVDLKNGDRVQIGKFVFRYRSPANPSAGEAATMPPEAAVIVVGSPAKPITTRVFQLGRRENSDVVFPSDAGISASHAVIFELDGQWCMRDLGSRTGTTVNGKPIVQQVLKFGDRIMIGSSTILFQPAAAETPKAEAAEPEQTLADTFDFAPGPLEVEEATDAFVPQEHAAEAASPVEIETPHDYLALADEVEPARDSLAQSLDAEPEVVAVQSEFETPTLAAEAASPVEIETPHDDLALADEIEPARDSLAQSSDAEPEPLSVQSELETPAPVAEAASPVEVETPRDDIQLVDQASPELNDDNFESASSVKDPISLSTGLAASAASASPTDEIPQTSATPNPLHSPLSTDLEPAPASTATPISVPALSDLIAPVEEFVFVPEEIAVDANALPDVIFWGDDELDQVTEQAVVAARPVSTALETVNDRVPESILEPVHQSTPTDHLEPGHASREQENLPVEPVAQQDAANSTPFETPDAGVAVAAEEQIEEPPAEVAAVPAAETAPPEASDTASLPASEASDEAAGLALTQTPEVIAPQPLVEPVDETVAPEAKDASIDGSVEDPSPQAVDHVFERESAELVEVPANGEAHENEPPDVTDSNVDETINTSSPEVMVDTIEEETSAERGELPPATASELPVAPVAETQPSVVSDASPTESPEVIATDPFAPPIGETVVPASNSQEVFDTQAAPVNVEEMDLPDEVAGVSTAEVSPVNVFDAGTPESFEAADSTPDDVANLSDPESWLDESAIATEDEITSDATPMPASIAGDEIVADDDLKPAADGLPTDEPVADAAADVAPVEASADTIDDTTDAIETQSDSALSEHLPSDIDDDATVAASTIGATLSATDLPDFSSTATVNPDQDLVAAPDIEDLEYLEPEAESPAHIEATLAGEMAGVSTVDEIPADALSSVPDSSGVDGPTSLELPGIESARNGVIKPSFSGVSSDHAVEITSLDAMGDVEAHDQAMSSEDQFDSEVDAGAITQEFSLLPETPQHPAFDAASAAEPVSIIESDLDLLEFDEPEQDHAGEEPIGFAPLGSGVEHAVESSPVAQVIAEDEPAKVAGSDLSGIHTVDEIVAEERSTLTQETLPVETPATGITQPPELAPPAAPPSTPDGGGARHGPSVFGIQFEGGSFLGGMPISLTGALPTPPGALPAAAPVLDALARPLSRLADAIPSSPPPSVPTPPSPPEPVVRPTTPPRPSLIAPAVPAAPVSLSGLVSEARVPWGGPPVIPPTVRSSTPGQKSPAIPRRNLTGGSAGPGTGARNAEVFSQLAAPIGVEVFGGLPGDPNQFTVPEAKQTAAEKQAAEAAEIVALAKAAPVAAPRVKKSRWPRLPWLIVLLFLIPTLLVAGIYQLVPISCQVVGSISYDGLAAQQATDQHDFRDSQKAMIYSDEVREGARNLLEQAGQPLGFTSDMDSYVETVDSPHLNQTEQKLEFTYNSSNELAAKAQVRAVLTSLTQKNRILASAKNQARAEASAAKAAYEEGIARYAALNRQFHELTEKAEDKPDISIVNQADEDAAKALQTWTNAKNLRQNSETALAELRSEDPTRGIDIEADPEVVDLKKQLQPLLDQIARLRGAGAIDSGTKAVIGTDVSVAATTQPDASLDPLLVPLQQQADALSARLNQRRSDLGAIAALGPQQRAVNLARAVEDLSIKITALTKAEADAKALSDQATARANQNHARVTAAHLADVKAGETRSLLVDTDTENKRAQQAEEDKDAALRRCITQVDSPVVNTVSKTDMRPKLAIASTVLVWAILGTMILGELRRPKLMNMGATPEAAPLVHPPVKVVPWPAPRELAGLEENSAATQPAMSETEQVFGV